MTQEEIKATIYSRLKREGFDVHMNYRKRLNNRIKGYRVVNLDLVILKNNKPIYIFYVGKPKTRKSVKYRILKLPITYVKEEKEIPKALAQFKTWAIKTLYS